MKMNVLLLLFLAAMVVRATSQPPNRIPFPFPYDYYSVVFQWEESACNTVSRRYQCTPIRHAFTLHGLWPDRPLDCRQIPGHTLFNTNLIPVNWNIIQYWPNMYGRNEDFWRGEYEKHGSCVVPFYSNQWTYFVTALRVATFTDLHSILKRAGIIPDGPTTVRAIRTAIQTSTGFWPTVQCNRNLVGTLQLYQIYLCYNRTTMMQINCPMIQKWCINPDYQIDYPWPYKYLPPERYVSSSSEKSDPHGLLVTVLLSLLVVIQFQV